MLKAILNLIIFYLSEHRVIVQFRWSPSAWGATWFFLFSAILLYCFISIFLHLSLSLILGSRRRCRIPLGHLPAIHSLIMSLISALIFAGLFFSANAEIRDTRWFWSPHKTPLQWYFCFPLGTRPAGRIFFWSYIYYLSRYLHMIRTILVIIKHRRFSYFYLFNQSIALVSSFLWLEFSQSFQVLAIMFGTLVYTVVYGYRFWTARRFQPACFPFSMRFQIVLLFCNLGFHLGVFYVHFYMKDSCNGIGAWLFNCILNVAVLMHALSVYVHVRRRRRRVREANATTAGVAPALAK